MSDRPCTCHPDDNPPVPCPQKFALQECRAAAPSGQNGPSDGTFGTWIASYRAVNGLLRQRAERAEAELATTKAWLLEVQQDVRDLLGLKERAERAEAECERLRQREMNAKCVRCGCTAFAIDAAMQEKQP